VGTTVAVRVRTGVGVDGGKGADVAVNARVGMTASLVAVAGNPQLLNNKPMMRNKTILFMMLSLFSISRSNLALIEDHSNVVTECHASLLYVSIESQRESDKLGLEFLSDKLYSMSSRAVNL